MASGRVERNLMIRLEGHIGCKNRVERKKQDTIRSPACQDQKLFHLCRAKKHRDEMLKEMACRFMLGRIKPNVVTALVQAEKTRGG